MAAPPSKRQRHDVSDTITVSAGKCNNSKVFTIHTSFATQSSKYMQAALKRDWKEGQEKHISLPEYEPEAVEGYINWLYTKEVTLKNVEERCKLHGAGYSQAAQNSECSHKHSLMLVKMYMFGDYLNDMQFCNAVIDTLTNMRGCMPGISTIQWVWENTMQDCAVRKYILEQRAGLLGNGTLIASLRSKSSKVPKDFLIDLLALTGDDHQFEIVQVFQERQTLADKCKFHKHVDDSDRCG